MRLAVFGSTGLSGAAVVRMALDRGHEVRALVRDPAYSTHAVPGVDVVQGDALDPHAVAQTISGADAVVSTLGGFRGPASIAAGTRNIIAAMREAGVRRLVVLQGIHIEFPGDPRNVGKHFVKVYLAMACRPLLSYSVELAELLQATDDVAWTLVRIPRMVEGEASGRATTGTFALGMFSTVRVDDVAGQLLDLAQGEQFSHEAPMLYTPKAPAREGTRTGAAGTRLHT